MIDMYMLGSKLRKWFPRFYHVKQICCWRWIFDEPWSLKALRIQLKYIAYIYIHNRPSFYAIKSRGPN